MADTVTSNHEDGKYMLHFLAFLLVKLQNKYVQSLLYGLIGICDSPTDDDFVMLTPPMAGVYNTHYRQEKGIGIVLKKMLRLL